MSVPSRKLYAFDKSLVNDCYFDLDRFYIRTPPRDSLTKAYRTASSTDSSQYDPIDIYETGHFLHELNHYMHQIGTPVCLFNNLLCTTSLIQISHYIKSFTSLEKRQVKLPLYDHMDEYPESITSSYSLSRAITSFMYCPFKTKGMFGIKYINKIKSIQKYSADLHFITHGRVQNPFVVFVLAFNKNSRSIVRQVPIGLSGILEELASLSQDHFLLHYFPSERTRINTDAIDEDERYLKYYLLRYYTNLKFDGLKKGEFGAIFSAALYLSLVNLDPLFHKNSLSKLDLRSLHSKSEDLFSVINHPSLTFFDSLDVLKEVINQDGGIERGEKGFLSFINKACKKMDMPPIGKIYDIFSRYLSKSLVDFYRDEFAQYLFTRHYFDLGLKVMSIAKEDPYTFLFFPNEIEKKVGDDLFPFAVKGLHMHKCTPKKIRWYLFSTLMQQLLHGKRIYCSEKYHEGTNSHCENDKECSIDKVDYPYSKCEPLFKEELNYFLGDFNKLIPS